MPPKIPDTGLVVGALSGIQELFRKSSRRQGPWRPIREHGRKIPAGKRLENQSQRRKHQAIAR